MKTQLKLPLLKIVFYFVWNISCRLTISSAVQKKAKMAIFSVYVVNKAGGLIYQYDNYVPRAEAEKTFSYPLDLVLKIHDEKVVVSFGQRDGIRGTVSCQQQSTDHMKAYKNVYSDNW